MGSSGWGESQQGRGTRSGDLVSAISSEGTVPPLQAAAQPVPSPKTQAPIERDL